MIAKGTVVYLIRDAVLSWRTVMSPKEPEDSFFPMGTEGIVYSSITTPFEIEAYKVFFNNRLCTVPPSAITVDILNCARLALTV